MILILIGMALIFLPLPIPIPVIEAGAVLFLDYMPHWLGYALVLWGLARSASSPSRGSAMAVAAGSILVSGVVWVVLMMGTVVPFPLTEIFQVLLTYYIMLWCEEQAEMEDSYYIGRLRLSWYALVGSRVAAIVLGTVMVSLGWMWSVAAIVAGSFYTYTYFRLRTLERQ